MALPHSTSLEPLVVEGLDLRVALFQDSPYGMISTRQLYEFLIEEAIEAAGRIARRWRRGRYLKNSFALLIMDPTMPVNATPSLKYVLGAVLIGPDAERLLKNAWAKIVGRLETGEDCGVAVFVKRHRLRNGRFNWGLTAELDGTLGGGSGLNQFQDKAEVAMFIAGVNEAVCTAIYQWEMAALAATGNRPSWLTENGTADSASGFAEVTSLTPIIGNYVLAA